MNRRILNDIVAAAALLCLVALVGIVIFVSTGLMVMLSRGLL